MTDILQEKYSDTMWEDFFQAENVESNEYRYVSGLHEICEFLNKSTEGAYGWKDVQVDQNGKISGLPKEMCKILNSQNCNAKYEELRDNIYMLNDYQNQNGLQGLNEYTVQYSFSSRGIELKKGEAPEMIPAGNSYYHNMETIF